VKTKKILHELFDQYSQYDYEDRATEIEKLILIIEGLSIEIEELKDHSHTIR